jgi:hypothetical protein
MNKLYTVTSAKVKPNATQIAMRRANETGKNGQKLAMSPKIKDDIESLVSSDLLILSGDKRANGSLKNLVDKRGREYECAVALVQASTVLDTAYSAKKARTHRKLISDAFVAALPDIIEFGLNIGFQTPTFPNLLGFGFEQNDEFQTAVWEMFLQDKVFHEFFYAGYAKTDWTLGGKGERKRRKRAFDLFLDGINYHIHALSINHKPLAAGETSKLEDRLTRLKAKKTDLKKSESHIIQFYKIEKRLIRNSLKVVKAWTHCLKTVYKKMVGKPLRIKTKSGLARFTFQNVSVDEIKNYDAGESKSGIFFEIAKTASYTAKGLDFKELTPELLHDAEKTFRNKRIINPFGAFRQAAQRRVELPISFVVRSRWMLLNYLVNQPTQQPAKPQLETDNTLFDNVLSKEKETLKKYGIRLCSQGLRNTWLNYLKVNAPLIIERRRNDLLGRFPHAVFTDLNNQTYYGWRAEKLIKQREKESKADYKAHTDKYRQFEMYRLAVYDADEFKRADDYYHFVNDIRRQRERKKYLKRVFRGVAFQKVDERYVPQTT